MASGAGGRWPRALWGRWWLYSWRHCSVRTCTSQRVSKSSRSKSSSLSLPLKLSTYPFSQGLPGVMKRVVAPTPWSHNRTALAVNSGPLSERRCSGTPRWTMRSPRHSMTWGERNERPTWMARHSLVYSSTTVRRRTGLPSLVRRATKSYAQTWFRRCGLSRTQEPSVSQSRPRLGCLAGILSPPRRQICSTRLWFTLHPSHCSITVTRRYPYRPYRLASRTTAIVRASSSSAIVAVYLAARGPIRLPQRRKVPHLRDRGRRLRRLLGL